MKEREVIKVRLNNLTKKHNDLENKHMILERNMKHLRECLNAYLVEPILGENYYNMGLDVQSSDKETVSAIKDRFDVMAEKQTYYKTVITILLSLLVAVSIVLISVLIGG